MPSDRPRVLVLDDWEGCLENAAAAARLRQLAEVTFLPVPLTEMADADLREVRCLLTVRERTRLDKSTLDRLPALELILQTGGHAYHVDTDEAQRRGIVLALWRSSVAVEAAMCELTFGLAIAALRRFPEAAHGVESGGWPGLLGGTLRGRRLGILGLGRQGRAVARLATAFGMDVVAWSRPGSVARETDEIRRVPLKELLATADVLSINLRLSTESRGLLTAEHLQSMKPGAVLINTARGAIVDQDALVEALRFGPLAAAGLDVFAHEPLPADSPLRSMPNVVITPHVGWTVTEAFEEFMHGAAGQLEDYLAHRLSIAELAYRPENRPDMTIGSVR